MIAPGYTGQHGVRHHAVCVEPCKAPLPEDATYASLAELLPALGLPIEQRPS